MTLPLVIYCFFFQAEDGIRDYKVTGVQTCALPIYAGLVERQRDQDHVDLAALELLGQAMGEVFLDQELHRGRARSEERRVGKECRSWWAPEKEKRKRTEALNEV